MFLWLYYRVLKVESTKSIRLSFDVICGSMFSYNFVWSHQIRLGALLEHPYNILCIMQ